MHWEQRGAGKSFSRGVSPSSLSVEQFQSDAEDVVSYLKTRFSKDRIFVIGHSWGTMLGLSLVSRHPENFMAYIGMGQAVDMTEAQKIGVEKLVAEAERRKNSKAVEALRALPAPPFSVSDMNTFFKWLMALEHIVANSIHVNLNSRIGIRPWH